MADVMARVNVKITNENANSSNIDQLIDFGATNSKDYAEILRDVQKQTNVALTKLVELQSTENIVMDDEDGEDSELDEGESSKKRRISYPENNNKKTRYNGAQHKCTHWRNL